MRTLLTAAVLVVAVVASVGSNPPLGGDLQGDAGPFSLTLDESRPTADATIDVKVTTTQSAVAGSGEMSVRVNFADDAGGSLQIDLVSDTSDQSTSTDVIDPIDQPEVELGLPMLEDCAGAGTCKETFLLTFTRVDEDFDKDLSLDWDASGSISLEVPDGESADGSLDFAVEEN